MIQTACKLVSISMRPHAAPRQFGRQAVTDVLIATPANPARRQHDLYIRVWFQQLGQKQSMFKQTMGVVVACTMGLGVASKVQPSFGVEANVLVVEHPIEVKVQHAPTLDPGSICFR